MQSSHCEEMLDLQEKDTRKIGIYARKSKITETGKSIETQITKCKSFAGIKFDASEDDIIIYQDEGLSGFYSDRPSYVKMLQDIKNNKIRAIICYKFDRISRRTIDLLNLVEQLRLKKIAFVSCTDDIDTSSKTGKIIMSLLASIAEFERDIIAERIIDNLYELAKEGRWLGGITPTGFVSKKTYISSGGKKTSINHLEPVPEEIETVKSIFKMFLEKRSIQSVVNQIKKSGIKTKNSLKHTRVSIKNILANPVYAIADEETYLFFKSFDVPIYAEQSDFNGANGLMIYNKTDQIKELKDDSTAIHPKYIQKTEKKEIREWIVSVGKHQGIISGKEWIQVQRILEENKDKYVRPNEKTESLLSGLICCPICGKNLFTHRESGRYTEGRPRFLYKCQTKRADKTACSYKDVKGNEIDRFVVDMICRMSHEDDEYYRKLCNNELLKSAQTESIEEQIKRYEKEITRVNREIESQTRNLRLAGENVKQFILDDLSKMSDELSGLTQQKKELDESARNLLSDLQTIQKTKEIIFSFPKLVETLTFQEKNELLRKVIEKVIVVRNKDGDDEVHIFVKGTSEKEYDDFFEKGSGGSGLCVRGKDSILDTSCGISRQSYSFGRIITGDSFNQPYSSYGYKVVRIGGTC